jgi:hypothetical protein
MGERSPAGTIPSAGRRLRCHRPARSCARGVVGLPPSADVHRHIAKTSGPRAGTRDETPPLRVLKLVKRQMYGRAKIDLLQARLVGANQLRKTSSRSRQSQI